MRLRFQKLLANLNNLAHSMGTGVFLSAAKADDLKKKYPEQAKGIDYLAEQDPTPTKKYLDWSVKMLLTGADYLELAEAVKQYDSLLPRLQGSDRDINSFLSLRDLKDAIEKAEKKETKGDLRKKSKKGGEILYEDDRWQLVHPTTMDGSIYYGHNTSWCVSRRDKKENYFYYYASTKNVQFYFIIDKQAEQYDEEVANRVGSGHHFSKVAVLFEQGESYEAEPFQDAANHKPSKAQVRAAIGSETFDKLYNIAHEHAKRNRNTWSFELLDIVDNGDAFDKLYKEHAEEVQYLDDEQIVDSAIRCGAKEFLLKAIQDAIKKHSRDGDKIIERIIKSDNVPEEIMLELASSNLQNIKQSLASNPESSEDVLLAILKDKHGYDAGYWKEDLAIAVAKNPNVFKHKKVLEELLNFKKDMTSFKRPDDRNYYLLSFEAEKLSKEEKDKQNKETKYEILFPLLENRDCDNATFKHAVDLVIDVKKQEAFYNVTGALSTAGQTSGQNLSTLMDYVENGSLPLTDPDLDYQRLANIFTSSDHATPELMTRLYEYLKGPAAKATASGDVMPELSNPFAYYDGPANVSYAINQLAISDKTPASVLRELTTNAASLGIAYRLLAQNPNLPPDLIDDLADRKELSIARNPSITPSAIDKLIDVLLTPPPGSEGALPMMKTKEKSALFGLVTNKKFSSEDYKKLLSRMPEDARNWLERKIISQHSMDIKSPSVIELVTETILRMGKENREENPEVKKTSWYSEPLETDTLQSAVDNILFRNISTPKSVIDMLSTDVLTSESPLSMWAAQLAIRQNWRESHRTSIDALRKLADLNNWNPEPADRGDYADDAEWLQQTAAKRVGIKPLTQEISRLLGSSEQQSKGLGMNTEARLSAAVEALHAIKASPSVLLAMEEAARLLSAAKADDLMKKYPEQENGIRWLAREDPTPTKKYLDWSVKMLLTGADYLELADVIKQYDSLLPRLQGSDRDIGSFKSLRDMKDAIEKAKGKETKGDVKKKAKKGGEVLYEDDRWMLVHPTTMDGAIHYGSNTSWCISRRDKKENYFYKYVGENNVQFYFLIDKQAEQYDEEVSSRGGHHFSKVAMLFAKGKPYADERFQDAANRRPSEGEVRNAVGDETFDKVYAIAQRHAKSNRTTWLSTIDKSTDKKEFSSLFEEHASEVSQALPIVLKAAIRVGALDLVVPHLKGANLKGANLTGANLTNANLTGANLTGASLSSANLANANLANANLDGARLYHVNLRNANLEGANLTNAGLTGANLTNANLTGANLTGAYLYNAYLTGANLKGIKYNDKTIWPEGFTPPQNYDTAAWLDASIEKLHDIKASPLVLLAMEEAAELLSAANVGGLDRNRATTVMIPIPKHLAARFPGVEHNNGHEPHLTVCFLSADKDMTVGKASEALAIIRRICRRQAPFRVGLDVNSGLHDFGPSEMGSKALWFDVRQDPEGVLDKLHRSIKNALKLEGIPVDSRHVYHPHVTWRYVSNDQSEGDRQRMSAFAASRFNDLITTWFDVKHLILSMPDGSQKAIALSPRLR